MQLPKFELKESINGNVFPGCSEFHILTFRSERAELVTLLSIVWLFIYLWHRDEKCILRREVK